MMSPNMHGSAGDVVSSEHRSMTSLMTRWQVESRSSDGVCVCVTVCVCRVCQDIAPIKWTGLVDLNYIEFQNKPRENQIINKLSQVVLTQIDCLIMPKIPNSNSGNVHLKIEIPGLVQNRFHKGSREFSSSRSCTERCCCCRML